MYSGLVISYRRDPEFRKAHPSYTPLEVIGLTTVFGNGPVEIMTSNALKLLELMGRTGAQSTCDANALLLVYCADRLGSAG